MKDLCDHNHRVVAETREWLDTEQFRTLCAYAEVDEDRTREVLVALCAFPPEVRREMLGEMIRSSAGTAMRGFGPRPDKKKGASPEADPLLGGDHT